MNKKIDLNIEYEFFTMEEVYDFYQRLNKDFSNPATKESLISFLFEFKTIEAFVKKNEIVFLDKEKFKQNGIEHFSIFFEEQQLQFYNYNLCNLSFIYKKNKGEDITKLIDSTEIRYSEKTVYGKYASKKLRDFICIYNSEKEIIQQIFEKNNERYVIMGHMSNSFDKNIINHHDLFINNISNIKNIYKIGDVFDIKKIKKIQSIFREIYVQPRINNLTHYEFLKNVQNINEIFPYVLNKSDTVTSELFEKLNKENQALVTVYMLEEDPSVETYLRHLQQTVKSQEEFYRNISSSKKVIPLIDRYTNKTVIDMTRYMKYENSVVFQFTKKDINDLMPHVSKSLVSKFFNINFPNVSKKMTALTYDGNYVISYRTDEKITTKEFVNYFINNITEWIENDFQIKDIEDTLDKYFRANKLINILEKNEGVKEIAKKKKI